MLTIDQTFVIAAIVGVAGVGLGVAIAVTARRSRSLASMADPAYNPDLDRREKAFRDALGEEADRLESEWQRKQERDR